MNKLFSVLVVALGITAVPLQAEPIKVDMKAGLWENKVIWGSDSTEGTPAIQPDQVKLAMEEMKKQLANMPPEQRKQMEAMMAQSGMKVTDDGVSFNNNQVEISPTGTNAKVCVTQAQIDRGELPDDVKGCESTLKKISATQFKSTHVCSGEYSGTGESEVTFHSPKHYTGTGKMNQVMNGEKRTMAFTMEGKWLSSDCGDVKPAQ
jgi:guanyl-specific ribonuclease Sa